MLVLGRLLKSWITPWVFLFLVGCSSTSLVKTYDGPQVDPSRSAVLSVSDGIEVLSVNGKEVKKYLLPELDLNYQLLPGVNIVTFTHETLWAKAGKKEEGESNAELIVTKPMMVRFNAKAGEVYHFNFESPESRNEALNNVATFDAMLVDSSGRFVAASALYVEGDDSSGGAVVAGVNNQKAALGSAPDNAAGGATVAVTGAAVAGGVVAAQATAPANTAALMPVAPVSAQGGALPTIEALKVLWESASTDEKKEFLKWAFK